MRKELNCPNCGSAITAEKCPYCGAVFYDFTAIKVNDVNEPCYVKIKYGDCVLMAEVIVSDMRVTIEPVVQSCWNGNHGFGEVHVVRHRDNSTIELTMHVVNKLEFLRGDGDD